MSFILKYLDEALDKVTGRYQGTEEGDDREDGLDDNRNGDDGDDNNPPSPPADEKFKEQELRRETPGLYPVRPAPLISPDGIVVPLVSFGPQGGVGDTREIGSAAGAFHPRTPQERSEQARHQLERGQQHQHHHHQYQQQQQQQRIQGSGHAAHPAPILADDSISDDTDDTDHLARGKGIEFIDDRNAAADDARSSAVDAPGHDNGPPGAQASVVEEVHAGCPTRMTRGRSTFEKGPVERIVGETLKLKSLGESPRRTEEGEGEGEALLPAVERESADIDIDMSQAVGERPPTVLLETEQRQSGDRPEDQAEADAEAERLRLQHLEREMRRKKLEEDRRARVRALEAEAVAQLRRRKRELQEEEERQRAADKVREREEEGDCERQRLRRLKEGEEMERSRLTAGTPGVSVMDSERQQEPQVEEKESHAKEELKQTRLCQDKEAARDVEIRCRLVNADRSCDLGDHGSAGAVLLAAKAKAKTTATVTDNEEEGRLQRAARYHGKLKCQDALVVRTRENGSLSFKQEKDKDQDPSGKSPPGQQPANAESHLSLTDPNQAREEAWAEAKMIAEGRARTRALRAAASRRETPNDPDGDGTVAAATPEEVNFPTSAPSSEAEIDLRESPRRGSVTLDVSGVAQPPSMEVGLEATGATQTRDGAWTGFLSDRRQQQKPTAPPSASSITSNSLASSQVSNYGDLPRGAPSAAAVGGPATPVIRPKGPHDFERIRIDKSRRRGGSRGGQNIPPQAAKETFECTACLGLWSEGGSALNRWYRCRGCGATVHSACRQFFSVAEACVEAGGKTTAGGESTNPPGWRLAVNCAGVVQVGVFQAFGLSMKPGESVYVALRLLPWKERVKTGSAKWGDLGASWPSDPSARHDLLHLYNSEASPIPMLRVEVWRSALRVLDDLVGYATINTAPLLARPKFTSERWHGLSRPSMETPALSRSPTINGFSSTPSSAGTILLSLGFFPSRVKTASSRPLAAPTTPSPILGNVRAGLHSSLSPSSRTYVGGLPGGDANRRAPGPEPSMSAAPVAVSLESTAEGESFARPETSSRSRLEGSAESTAKSSPESLGGGSSSVVGSGSGSGRTRPRGRRGHEGHEQGRGQEEGTEGRGVLKDSRAKRDARAGDGPKAENGVGIGGRVGDVGSEGTGEVHLFRMKSYPSPVWCQVCGGFLLGVRNQGFCCEACGMNVHQGCQLRASFAGSCPGRPKESTEEPDQADQNAASVSAAGGGDGPAADGGGPATAAAAAATAEDSSERWNVLNADEGVGLIRVHLRSAHRCGSRCHGGHHSYIARNHDHNGNGRGKGHGRDGLQGLKGEGDTAVVTPDRRLSGPRGVHGGFYRGDHYCRIRVSQKGPSSPSQEARTEAVFQTPEPLFDRSWTFAAPSYDAIVTIDLVDASTDRPVGRFEASVIALLQEDYDARAVRQMPPSQKLGERKLLSPGAVADEENVTGLLQVRLEIDENTEAFFGPEGILQFFGPAGGSRLRRAPPRKNADLSVESLKTLLGRVKAVLFWLKVAGDGYQHVMSWENPTLSFMSLLSFLYLFVVGDTEYLLALLPLSLLLFMARGYLRRRSGDYVHDWISHAGGTIKGSGTAPKVPSADFRSVAMLRAAVVTGRGIISSDLQLPGNCYVRVTYVPKSRADVDGNHHGSEEFRGSSEYLVGQTAPQYTGGSPAWSRAGVGMGGGGGGGVLGLGGATGTVEYNGGSDALLQNVVEVWNRDAPREHNHNTCEYKRSDRFEGRGYDFSYDPSYDFSDCPPAEEDMCLVYPLLQPSVDGLQRVLPWSESTGFLRFSIVFANPFNRVMDRLQGEVTMPVACLVKQNDGGTQPEIRGWFKVYPVEDDLDATGSPKPERPTGSPSTLGANALKEGKPAKPDGMEPSSPESQAGDDHKSKPDLQPEDPISENPSDSSIGDNVNITSINSSHDDGHDKGHGIGNTVVGVDGVDGTGGGVGSLFLRLQLTLPDKDAPVSTEDLETSRALQILLGETSEGGAGRQGSGGIGGAAGSNDAGAASGTSDRNSSDVDSKSDRNGKQSGPKDSGGFAVSLAPSSVARLIGLPMGVLTTARDIQDNVSEVLDKLEAIKQLLNWTHPHKTSIVFAIVALAWVVLMIVPGRYILLLMGLYEFSKVWLSSTEGSQEAPPHAIKQRPERERSQETAPLAIKLQNLLVSLPVDADLSACYVWESRAFAKKEMASKRLREQRAKLRLLGGGHQWEGDLRVRNRTGDPWESRYVVVLGHRMAWWRSRDDLDHGKKAKGQLLLQGHAGVTHLSPMEAREVSDSARVLCVFGRSPEGLPHKVSLMADTTETKATLEDAISLVVETKRD